MNKIGFSIIVFGLIIMVAAVLNLTETLGTGMCGNKLDREVLSPNGQSKAVIFSRDCGAGINFSTNISVQNAADALPDKLGNVLVQEKSSPDVHWENDQTLVVRYESNIPVQTKSESIWLFRFPLPQQVNIRFEKR